MMHNTEFNHWLNRAVKGLPAEVAEPISDELTAHFEDARDEYVAAGLALEEAHRAALADLGDARSTARALRETHLAYRRYIRAACASITPLLGLLLYVTRNFAQGTISPAPNISDTMILVIVMSTLTIFCTFYLLRAFETLAGTRNTLSTPVKLIRWGLLSLLPLYIIFALFFWQPASPTSLFVMVLNDPIVVVNTPYIVEEGLRERLIFHLPTAFSTGLIGVGWLMMGARLEVISDRFHGIYQQVRLAFVGSGFCLLVLAMSTVLYHPPVLFLASMLVIIMGAVKFALCTLLFFRAAYFDRLTPSLMA